jgi:hypothetical protein
MTGDPAGGAGGHPGVQVLEVLADGGPRHPVLVSTIRVNSRASQQSSTWRARLCAGKARVCGWMNGSCDRRRRVSPTVGDGCTAVA